MSILLNSSIKKKGMVTNGLIFYVDGKDFLNSPSTSIWRDRSNNGNNLTAYNFSYNSTSGSNNYGGVALNGTTNYLQSNVFSFNMLSQTIECSFVMNRSQAYQCIFEIWDNGHTSRYGRFMDYGNGVIGYSMIIGGANTYTTSATVPIGSKVHLIGTYDGQNLKIYVNGVFISNFAQIMNLASLNGYQVNYLIGNEGTGSRYFQGTIYSVRVYNRVLTQSEILQNYNASI